MRKDLEPMARMRKPRRGSPQKNRAKLIIQSMAGRGAQRASLVQRRVERAGVSTRTYRTARKEMRTLALRKAVRGAKRGRGRWFVKARRYSRR
jgi:hypothetical protein